MDEITPADLEAVKLALLGAVTALEVATDYSSVQKALLANAAFTAANFTEPSWKGQLRELLVELTLASLEPKNGWATASKEELEQFGWYYREKRRVMRASRMLDLHGGDQSGNHLQINPHDQICRLLEDARCRHEARAIFDAANAKVNAKREAKLDYSARVRKFRAAAKRHPEFKYFFVKHLSESYPQAWGEVYAQLGELLQKYLPEHLPK